MNRKRVKNQKGKIEEFPMFLNKVKVKNEFSVFSKKPAVIVIININ